ncbi:unnamed protein product, partial [Closterium sp. NIES-53]
MSRNCQKTTGFTRASRLPSTNVYRFARCRSAHSVTLAHRDSQHRPPRPLRVCCFATEILGPLWFLLVYSPSPAPPATTDSATRSQWLTRDAVARLAICNHLPLAERAHFGQQKTVKALYDVVVARYSSPATAALGRLILPYLFLELSAFATVEDLVAHLRTSDARYRSALPADFLDRNPPPPPPLD